MACHCLQEALSYLVQILSPNKVHYNLKHERGTFYLRRAYIFCNIYSTSIVENFVTLLVVVAEDSQRKACWLVLGFLKILLYVLMIFRKCIFLCNTRSSVSRHYYKLFKCCKVRDKLYIYVCEVLRLRFACL